jgi:N-acyl-D-aspartate/D-glutamate deacylase
MGFDDRAPTGTELAAMRDLVTRAMRESACGLSSGLIDTPGSFTGTTKLATTTLIKLRQVIAATMARSDEQLL